MNNFVQPENKNPVDAAVLVTVSQDHMLATLHIDPPQNGGVEATPGMIDEAIKKAKVTSGLDTELIKAIKQKPEYKKNYFVARGVQPQNGIDGTIKHHFRIVSQKPVPKEREDGTVDYRDLDLIVNVRNGDVLSTITLPTQGTPGMSVLGRKLLQYPGRPVPPPLGKNTVYNADQTQIIAACDGQVILEGQRVNVFDTFTVPENVDPSTGNIRFVGNVHVNGNVQQGFIIEAEKSIEISGNVEGGIIRSGGDITIRGGVVGMGCSKIECGGNLKSTFLENCEASVKGSLNAESVMNSFIRCGGNLELTGRHAKLMGGKCLVGKDITANTIGSPANLPTELIIGADPSIMSRRTFLTRENERLETQKTKLGQIITLLSQFEAVGRLTPNKSKLLDNSRASLDQTEENIKKNADELEEINKAINESGNGRIVCKDIAYHGVNLTIGLAYMEIGAPIYSSTFSKTEGEIVVTPITY